MLQEARNISKATSTNRDPQKSVSFLKNDNPVNHIYEYNYFNNERNNSEVSNKCVMAPWTRNKTRIFSLDSIKYCREESDPAFRPSVFNETNQFITADHYFGYSSNPWPSMVRNNPSNPLFNQNKECITNLKSPRFADKNIMPPLKTENLKNNIANNKPKQLRVLSTPMAVKNSSTPEKDSVKNIGRSVSLVYKNSDCSKGSIPIATLRSTSVPRDGAFTKFQK